MPEALIDQAVTRILREKFELGLFDHPYVDAKRALSHDNRTGEILIAAFLMEVRSLSLPYEADRNPTWFTPEEAKQRLAEQRASKYSRELERMVDAATRSLRRSDKKRFLGPERRSRRLFD